MTKFQINITKEVLEKTKNCSQEVDKNCAISYAVRQLMPHASIGEQVIYPLCYAVEKMGGIESFKGAIFLPEEAIEFIETFDSIPPAMRPFMKEFSFEIEMSDSTLELLVPLADIEELLKDSTTLKLVTV